MKCGNACRMRLALLGFVVVFVLSDGSANADFILIPPVRLGPPAWTAGGEPKLCCFSKDGLELYFSENRSGGYGQNDIWVARRETVDAPWGEPVNLGPNVNSSQSEVDPAISPDGLDLYLNWMTDEWLRVCSRPSKDAPWSKPVLMGPPFSGYHCIMTEFSADGLSFYSVSNRPGRYGHADIWVSTRSTSSAPWSNPVNLGPNINSSFWEFDPSISSDGRVLFFSSNQRTGGGTYELFFSTRATTADPWGPMTNCQVINRLGGNIYGPALSPNGSVLYFTRDGLAYQSSVITIVDFNGDEIVNINDLVILIEYWGTNETLYDIGPMPWGDGKVDANDLEVLMSYWQQEVLPVSLLAYWRLDETEGTVASDSAGDKEGTLNGNPIWQPTAGKVNGALQLDGVDDYVSTPFVLNPADGAFSVFAWVKAGGPGQVVLSQIGGANWLLADPVEGKLMTGLSRPPGGRGTPQPLVSEFIVTDGIWHRVGFVWDGSNRILYSDNVEVARDTQASLEGSTGGLYIGAGKNLEAGSFFSGLIDDVRLYNREVKP